MEDIVETMLQPIPPDEDQTEGLDDAPIELPSHAKLDAYQSEADNEGWQNLMELNDELFLQMVGKARQTRSQKRANR